MGLTILLGAFMIFSYGLLLYPVIAYGRHLDEVLHGRVRQLTGAFKEMEEGAVVRDGVQHYPMTLNVGDMESQEDDRLFYYDAPTCPGPIGSGASRSPSRPTTRRWGPGRGPEGSAMSEVSCILVCVTAQKNCARLIDRGRALSARLHMPVRVLHVAAAAHSSGQPGGAEILNELFSLARSGRRGNGNSL